MVHVFFRIHDPMSVLIREELEAVLSLESVKKTIFHPMINNIDFSDTFDIEELSVYKRQNPYAILKNFLVKVSQKTMNFDRDALSLYKSNIRSINEMKLD